MKKILIILFSLLFFSLSAQAKVKSKDIKFPAGVYTDEIKSCKAIGYASLERDYDVWVKRVRSTYSMQDFQVLIGHHITPSMQILEIPLMT